MNHLLTLELAARDLLVTPTHHQRPKKEPRQHTTHHTTHRQEDRK